MGHFSTAAKVRIAGALYRVIAKTRALAGRSPDRVICRRRGVRWDLDLREGIPLGIYLGTFEPATARAWRRLLPAGGVAIDIGANIGAHALPMARHVGEGGRVIAVEPTATAFAALGRNLELNPGLDRILLARHAAVVAPGDTPPAAYYSSWPLTGTDAVHAVHRGRLQSTSGTEGITLDELVARDASSSLDLVKLDVDGGEVGVLQGGRATLHSRRPAIVLELCPYTLEEQGTSLRELLALLEAADYRLVDEGSWRPVPSGAAALERTIPTGGSINVAALPRERNGRAQG